MSFNISNFRVNDIRDLIIDIEILKSLLVRSRDLAISKNSDGLSTIFLMGGPQITGFVTDDNLTVKNLEFYGDHSGLLWEEVMVPVLRQSKGILEAILIWDSGQFIECFNLTDGNYFRSEVFP